MATIYLVHFEQAYKNEGEEMKHNEHAPAPWSVEVEHYKAIIHDAHGQYVTSVSIYNNTDEANASVIAAAPEMLALLERIVSDETWLHLSAWWTDAREIIAKAKGEPTNDTEL